MDIELNQIIATIGFGLIVVWYLCMLWSTLTNPRLKDKHKTYWFIGMIALPVVAVYYYANVYGGKLQFQKSLRQN